MKDKERGKIIEIIEIIVIIELSKFILWDRCTKGKNKLKDNYREKLYVKKKGKEKDRVKDKYKDWKLDKRKHKGKD